MFQTFLGLIQRLSFLWSPVFKPVGNRQKEEKIEEDFLGQANSVLQHSVLK